MKKKYQESIKVPTIELEHAIINFLRENNLDPAKVSSWERAQSNSYLRSKFRILETLHHLDLKRRYEMKLEKHNQQKVHDKHLPSKIAIISSTQTEKTMEDPVFTAITEPDKVTYSYSRLFVWEFMYCVKQNDLNPELEDDLKRIRKHLASYWPQLQSLPFEELKNLFQVANQDQDVLTKVTIDYNSRLRPYKQPTKKERQITEYFPRHVTRQLRASESTSVLAACETDVSSTTRYKISVKRCLSDDGMESSDCNSGKRKILMVGTTDTNAENIKPEALNSRSVEGHSCSKLFVSPMREPLKFYLHRTDENYDTLEVEIKKLTTMIEVYGGLTTSNVIDLLQNCYCIKVGKEESGIKRFFSTFRLSLYDEQILYDAIKSERFPAAEELQKYQIQPSILAGEIQDHAVNLTDATGGKTSNPLQQLEPISGKKMNFQEGEPSRSPTFDAKNQNETSISLCRTTGIAVPINESRRAENKEPSNGQELEQTKTIDDLVSVTFSNNGNTTCDNNTVMQGNLKPVRTLDNSASDAVVGYEGAKCPANELNPLYSFFASNPFPIPENSKLSENVLRHLKALELLLNFSGGNITKMCNDAIQSLKANYNQDLNLENMRKFYRNNVKENLSNWKLELRDFLDKKRIDDWKSVTQEY